MRIALAQIIQESNSFAPTKTTRDHFASQYIRKGNSVFEHLGDAKIELTGMLSVLELAGAACWPGGLLLLVSGGPNARFGPRHGQQEFVETFDEASRIVKLSAFGQ